MEPCERYLDWISACLDGALTEAERRELMEHLAECGACRDYFSDQMAVRGALLDLEAPAPEDLTARVMERVRRETEERRNVVRFPDWRRWAALAACCAVVCLAVWTGLPKQQAGETPAVSQQQTEVAPDAAPEEAAASDPEGPAAYSGDVLVASAAPALDSTARQAEAAEAAAPARDSAGTRQDELAKSAALSRLLTAEGPAVQGWVEQELGQSWALGRVYALTEEQYGSLTARLAEAGEAFSESAAEGEGWFLLAGAPEP